MSHSARPAADRADVAPMRAAGAMPGGHGAIATAFQTVLVVLLAWAALLWSGLVGAG